MSRLHTPLHAQPFPHGTSTNVVANVLAVPPLHFFANAVADAVGQRRGGDRRFVKPGKKLNPPQRVKPAASQEFPTSVVSHK